MTTEMLPILYIGDELVISNALSKWIIDEGTAGSKWQQETVRICCPDIEWGQLPVVPPSPAVESAWWYNPNIPESAGFSGPIIDTEHFRISKGWASGTGSGAAGFGGSGIPEVSPAARIVSMRLVFLADSPAALAYGVEATQRKLGVYGDGRRCEKFRGVLWTGCGDELRREFCAGRIVDCQPASQFVGDSLWLGTHGSSACVGCVLDITLAIEDGCLWGLPQIVEPMPLAGSASTLELCNPGAIDPAGCCSEVASLFSELINICAPIPEEFRCPPLTPFEPVPPDVCDKYCPPIFVCRNVLQFPTLADPLTEYGPSFTVSAGPTSPLLQTEVLIYPAELFTASGVDPLDPRLGPLGLCIAPTFRARLPYLPAGTSVTFDGRCGETSVECDGANLTYAPEDLWSVSGFPTSGTLAGNEGWVMIVDTKCDQPGAEAATVSAQLAPCFRS